MTEAVSVAELLAERDRLRAALAPFALAYASYTAHDPSRRLIGVRNGDPGVHDITVEHLARAWEAYRMG